MADVSIPSDVQLVAAIKALAPRLRKVFVMAHVEGKSADRIANELRLARWRVERRMTKALATCREQLRCAECNQKGEAG